MAKTLVGNITELAPPIIHGKALTDSHPSRISHGIDGAVEAGLVAANIGNVWEAIKQRDAAAAVAAAGLALVYGLASKNHLDRVLDNSPPDFSAMPTDLKIAERVATITVTTTQILVNRRLGK